ncbi:hypothetical protein [Brassicibacter mesophilus]|uniref:hypothetical protein n=1 Tax=Brassicibacter mesophilus TaxID=745119 RepID=UPI003D19BB1C
MNCVYHNDSEANFICSECGSNICKECAVNNNGRIVCLKCAKKNEIPIIKNTANNGFQQHNNIKTDNNKMNNANSTQKKYSSFWATVFSFIPGAGHMYLGIMNRGLQLMLVFFGVIAVTNLFYSADFLMVFTVIVWFYSFFDCYHIRKKIDQGEIVENEPVFNLDLNKINMKHVGIGLVSLGGLILFDEMLSQLMYMSNRISVNPEVIRIFRNAVFPVVLIVIGAIILRKAKENISA